MKNTKVTVVLCDGRGNVLNPQLTAIGLIFPEDCGILVANVRLINPPQFAGIVHKDIPHSQLEILERDVPLDQVQSLIVELMLQKLNSMRLERNSAIRRSHHSTKTW